MKIKIDNQYRQRNGNRTHISDTKVVNQRMCYIDQLNGYIFDEDGVFIGQQDEETENGQFDIVDSIHVVEMGTEELQRYEQTKHITYQVIADKLINYLGVDMNEYTIRRVNGRWIFEQKHTGEFWELEKWIKQGLR